MSLKIDQIPPLIPNPSLQTLYRNNMKNREFVKEAPQNFCHERATIAQGQGASEDKNFEIKPITSNPPLKAWNCDQYTVQNLSFNTDSCAWVETLRFALLEFWEYIYAPFEYLVFLFKQKFLGDDLPNFHRVSAHLFRGAHPSEKGLYLLQSLGIKTVINLCQDNLDKAVLKKIGIQSIHLPFETFHPTEETLLSFLRIVQDSSHHPIFIHCFYGADRTGFLCAVFRIFVEGWSKNAAIAEMIQGGFGFHLQQKNLVEFLNQLDIPKLQKALAKYPK